MPWNQQTALGCFSEIVFHILTAQSYLFLNGVFLVLFISLCLHHGAFYERFRYSMNKWNETGSYRNDRKSFCELMQFHILVKK